MTTILAVQRKNGFTVAADRQVTADERPYYHRDVNKITQVGDYVIAGAGVSRYCDIVQYGWQPPKYDGSELYTFMVSQFVPALRKIHEETGYTLKEDEVFKFIVGLRKQLFYIAEDYSVLRSNKNVYGIGTGAAYAIGAFEAGASVTDALRIAIKYDVNSGGGIQIVEGE